MAVAKGIGGGFPLGACLATREAAKGMTVGTPRHDLRRQSARHGVGNAVLDVVLEPGFLDRVRAGRPAAASSASPSCRTAIPT